MRCHLVLHTLRPAVRLLISASALSILAACTSGPDPTPTSAPATALPSAATVPAAAPSPTSPAATATPEPPTGTPTAVIDTPVTEAFIMNFAFPEIEIPVGQRVRWVNHDSAPHTVSSGAPGQKSGLFDSGRRDQNQTFEFTFAQAGAFAYFCEYHPNMTALVVVGEGGAPAPTATALPPTPAPTATPQAALPPATPAPAAA
ncbi:MAG: hypothetical protein FJ319_03540, partial [SAR202 cluster bacterium]|nr:hypothetical protein [SAR202 cluster bacterium]